MWRYGQYCPLAHALEILGDRWTLLIVRDLMKGICRFNDLERGLPGISRGLLSKRLQLLQKAGIIEKRSGLQGRSTTAYALTEAGWELEESIEELWQWGTRWAFGEPTLEELNSPLLMWRLHKDFDARRLPAARVVVQFDFHGAESSTYWLVLNPDDVSLCLTDPGFDINLLVTADLSTFFQVWAQRVSYEDALSSRRMLIEGPPGLVRDFPKWFDWSHKVEVERSRN